MVELCLYLSRYGYGLNGRDIWVRFPVRVRYFSTLQQPPIQLVPRALSLGVKVPEREYDHSPISRMVEL